MILKKTESEAGNTTFCLKQAEHKRCYLMLDSDKRAIRSNSAFEKPKDNHKTPEKRRNRVEATVTNSNHRRATISKQNNECKWIQHLY